MAAGKEKPWGGKRSVGLRWGCASDKCSAEEWLHNEREGSNEPHTEADQKGAGEMTVWVRRHET